MISDFITDEEYLSCLHKQNDNTNIFDEIQPGFDSACIDEMIDRHFKYHKLFESDDEQKQFKKELPKQITQLIKLEFPNAHVDTSRMSYTTILDTGFSVPEGELIMRGRKHNKFFNQLSGVQDAYLNLPCNIKNWGRLNKPGEQILYLGTSSKTVERELRLKPGDCYEMFFYRLNQELCLTALTNDSIDDDKKPKSTALLNHYLNEIMTHEISSKESYKYVLSREISRYLFNYKNTDGWSYPSVADNEGHENIALRVESARKIFLIGSASIFYTGATSSCISVSAILAGKVKHFSSFEELQKLKPDLFEAVVNGN